MKKFFEFLVEDRPENKEAPVRITHTRPTFKLNPDVAMRNLRKDYEDKLDTDKPLPGKKIAPGKYAGGNLGFADDSVIGGKSEKPQPNRTYGRRITKLRDEIFGKGKEGYQYDPKTSSETEMQYGENKLNQLQRLSELVGNNADDDHIDKIKNIIGTSQTNDETGDSTTKYNLSDKILDVMGNGKFDLSNEKHIEFLKKHVYDISNQDDRDGDLKSLSKLDFSNPGVNAVLPGISELFNNRGESDGYGKLLDRDDVKTMISNLSDDGEKGIDRGVLRKRLEYYQSMREVIDKPNYMFNEDSDDHEVEDIHDVVMGMMSGRLNGDDITDMFDDDDFWEKLNTEDYHGEYNDGSNYNYAGALLQSISRHFNNNDQTPAMLSSLSNMLGESGNNINDIVNNDTLDYLQDMMGDYDFSSVLKNDAITTLNDSAKELQSGFDETDDSSYLDMEDWWKDIYTDNNFVDEDIDADSILRDYEDLDYGQQSDLRDELDVDDHTFSDVLNHAREWMDENKNEVESSSFQGDHVNYTFQDNSKWDYDLNSYTIDSIQDVADEIGVTPGMRRYIEWSNNVNKEKITEKWKERFGNRPFLDRRGNRREEIINFGKQIVVFDAIKTWRKALKDMEPGTVLQNSPMSGGTGDNMREVLYNKMGFGRYGDDGQFGIVGDDGKVYPVNDFDEDEKEKMKQDRQDARYDREKERIGPKSNIGRKARDVDDKFREKFPQQDEVVTKALNAKDKLAAKDGDAIKKLSRKIRNRNNTHEETPEAARRYAQDQGWRYKGFGYWEDNSGSVYKTEGGRIIKTISNVQVYPPTEDKKLKNKKKRVTMNKRRSKSND